LKPSKLPPRWRFRHGAYFYRVPADRRHLWDGKGEFRLGATEAEAWRTWFSRLGDDGRDDIVTMHDVFDGWYREYVLVELSESTQAGYLEHVKPLRRVFGDMLPQLITVQHAYAYRKKRPPVAGNREVSVLSSALTWAVEAGVIATNPLRGQISRKGRNRETPRQRSPSNDEINAFLDFAPHPILRGYVGLKRITGLRQGQLLAIDLGKHYQDGVLHPPISKGGKDTSYHGEALEAVIEYIVYRRHGVPGLLAGRLFVNRRGQPYTSSGFKSIWQKAMRKWEAAGHERFTEHDIRRAAANECETLEHAQALLGHQDPKITARVYRSATAKVEVLKR
jgi:integrase